ncbi:MAG: chemotaxis protein CheB [Chloroflexales bacterium]
MADPTDPPLSLANDMPQFQPEAPVDSADDLAMIPDDRFPIVGIGASAGGLAAFEAFFSAMPDIPAPNIAFVLVQHLAPDHKSILSDLIRRYTPMQVFEVTDGMVVQPNCAYIIPPNRNMALLNGTLQLIAQAEPRGLRLPIDFFFRSLAQDLRERAICIVLSGTGSDGTLGLRAVKGEGGMVMAQTPESTEYDGMPRSAIATGMVDYVLAPAAMPAQLATYVAHSFGIRRHLIPPPLLSTVDTLKKICVVLRAQTGHDFSQYKERTLIRRIERRMALHQIERADEYLAYLQQQMNEVDALFRDLLIGVTSFFRDPEAFAILESQVIPRIFATHVDDQVVRVWVCGCSTGEEAYSLSMLVQEYLESLRQPMKVHIFATDIDSRAIEHARSGIFPASIAADIAPDRLARFFVLSPDGESYRIHKTIRDLLIFSVQDVIKDPPFSKLDLISCRNLLIYLNADLQRKLIPLFHYALNPAGVLFLGTSETVGELTSQFALLDRKAKLYLRQDEAPGIAHLSLSDFVPVVPDGGASLRLRRGASQGTDVISLRGLAEQALLAHYDPVGILINGSGEILHIIGWSGTYLQPAPGDAGMHILAMAREGLRRDLFTALHRAVALREVVRYPGLRVRTNGDFTTVNLTVRPVIMPPSGIVQPDMFMVVLEAVPLSDLPQALANERGGAQISDHDTRVTSLEYELQSKEAYIQTTLEEMETANEELMSANEELQSLNEELQSTNEELETSKEELQSVNEELITVNAEMQYKVAELSRANNDMNNLLAGTGVGTLFVDMGMRIARFTPMISSVINLIMPDVGRPVSDIASNLVGDLSIVDAVREVLDTLVPKEAEVQTRMGAWYLMRIRPYRTLDQVIEGAVLTFIDITQRKQVEATLRQSETKFAGVFRAIPDGLVVSRHSDGVILDVNERWQRMSGVSRSAMLGRSVHDPGIFVDPTDWHRMLAHMAAHGVVRSMDLEIWHISGRRCPVRLTVEPFDLESEPCLLMLFHDPTDQAAVEEASPPPFEGRLGGGTETFQTASKE